LKEALLEKSKEDWLERHLFAQKKQVLQTLEAQPSNSSMYVDPKEQTLQQGRGKGKKKGKGKGKVESQPFRAPQNTNFKENNAQTAYGQSGPPRFSATIWCKWCKKKGHYEDSCWSKEKYERKKKSAEKKDEKSGEI